MKIFLALGMIMIMFFMGYLAGYFAKENEDL